MNLSQWDAENVWQIEYGYGMFIKRNTHSHTHTHSPKNHLHEVSVEKN